MYRKETTRHHSRKLKAKEASTKIKTKRKARKLRKESGAPAGIPKTLETLQKKDETVIKPDDTDVLIEEEFDELAPILNTDKTPRILLTHSDRVCPRTIGFCKELARIIPNLKFAPRWHFSLKKLIPRLIELGYTALIVINEDQKKINNLVISHLPDGPTATFKLTNVKVRRQLRGLKAKAKQLEPDIIPHIVTNRFSTQVGRRVERILTALFPIESRSQKEMASHSRTVAFHNQRDYIFFRHFRYQHKLAPSRTDSSSSGEKTDYVAMNEVGPRFTLRLRSIQLGTFDSQFGDYEWVRKTSEAGRSKHNFVL